MSERNTLGFEPSLLFRIEKNPCSPDAKCVLCERHMAQSSLLAQAPVSKSTPRPSETCMIRERIDLLLSDCSSLPPERRLASIACAPRVPTRRPGTLAPFPPRQSNTATAE